MSFEEAISTAGVSKPDIVKWREAKIFAGVEDETTYKGYIILTKEELMFVRSKKRFSSTKVMYRVPVKKIKKIQKIRIFGRVMISANLADKDSGFFKKMFSGKNAQFKIDDADTFIAKVEKEMKE